MFIGSWRRIALVLLMVSFSAVAQERLRVITTTSDLRSLVEIVGGERVTVSNLVSPKIDAEEYQPQPKDLERLRAADLVVRIGVDYDLWLDRLLAKAGKVSLYPGQPGYVDASQSIALLEIRGNAVGPGHAHGSGNPHYWLDPANARTITWLIMEALVKRDPGGGKYYEGRLSAFLTQLNARLQDWTQILAPAQGRPIVAYHNSWAYFARRFRLQIAAVIEDKPGVPPSPARIASILRVMREKNIGVIVRQPHEPVRNSTFIASRAGASVAVLAASVDAVPQASDYLSMIDYNVKTLALALQIQKTQ
jgi:ABC-type Zn uptake system ZnuABC Zn-binding protein ZnuA